MIESEANIQQCELSLTPRCPPLRVDDGKVVRVGNSRITLDLLVEQFENGMSPEDLVRAYDALHLADVYGAIDYYLRHKPEVLAYLDTRKKEAEALRQAVESERPRILPEELNSRRATREKVDAPPGQ